MKLNKYIILLYITGIIAGLALFFTPLILRDIESEILGFACFFTGLGLSFLSLILLDRYISKRRRPQVLRRQEIELKDERNSIIRDKAGAKALGYLWFMILISLCIYTWFDVEYDYVRLIFWILLINCIIYFAHSYYYKKHL